MDDVEYKISVSCYNINIQTNTKFYNRKIIIIIINSLHLCRDRRMDRTKKKQYNSKFTIVKVNVNLQSSVQVWFNSNIVLVIKFLSKMLVWYEVIWRLSGLLAQLDKCLSWTRLEIFFFFCINVFNG